MSLQYMIFFFFFFFFFFLVAFTTTTTTTLVCSCSITTRLEQTLVTTTSGYDRHMRNRAKNHVSYLEDELRSGNNNKWRKLERAKNKLNEVNVDHFGALGNGIGDDTEAFRKAWKKACNSNFNRTILNVSARKDYNLRPITFSGPCNSAITMNIRGKISGSKNLADYKRNTRFWLIFANVTNLAVHGGGTIDGNGHVWWPKHCKIDKTQPCESGATAVTFTSCSNLKIGQLNLKNAQRMHLTIDNCTNVEASRIKINAPATSPNTDGIHISASKFVRIKHSIIRTGDDCISIVSGSHRIKVTHVKCGPGHGISIGSLGKDGARDVVSNIKVNKATIIGTENGARIKSWQGGKGVAENIMFENIFMKKVKNPIIIDQFYCDKSSECPTQKEAVKIRNVVFKNIRGESASEKGITLNCSLTVPCEGIKLENIELSYEGRTSLASCSSAKVSQFGKLSPHCPST